MAWKQPQWFEWEREATVHPIAWFLEGVTVNMPRFFGRGWPDTYLFYRNDVVFWINRMDALCGLGQYLVGFLSKPANMRRLEEKLAADTETIKRLYFGIGAERLKRLSDAELIALHDEFYQQYTEWAVAGSINEPVYLQGEVLLRQLLEGQAEPEKKLAVLTACTRESFSMRAQRELLGIAVREGASAGNFGEKIKLPAVAAALEAHARKYFWMQNGYRRTETLGPEYFAGELKALLAENDPAKYLAQLESAMEERKARREALMRELGFSARERTLASIIDYNAWLQDYRKEVICEASHYLDLLLGEIAARAGVPLEEAKYALGSEAKSLLEGSLARRVLSARRRECALYVLAAEGKCRILEGTESRELERRLSHSRAHAGEIVELSGMTANPGRVQGRAFVTMDAKAAARGLKKGDVLVTSMTTPDFAPALKKAAAVVTNEGGITCHAAIIAREFGLPCVVGTRIATQALSTGDWVEVDGNHGKVRKLVKQ